MDLVTPSMLGLHLLTPCRFGDHRGFFAEIYRHRAYSALGIDATLVQGNHSLSPAEDTVRGLYFQAQPHAQAKLVRCGRGAIIDVAVDIRRSCPTLGH
jgi:dTDP-4-dehydrorhamnose 3,5-epimerase